MVGVAAGRGPHQGDRQGGAAEGGTSREARSCCPPGLATQDGLGSVCVLSVAPRGGPRAHGTRVRGFAHTNSTESVSGPRPRRCLGARSGADQLEERGPARRLSSREGTQEDPYC